LSYGSSGTGTPIHLAAELLKRTLGIPITHVPYKGSANALTDLMGGHVDLAVDAVLTGFRAVTAGQAVAIAVTTEKRVPAAPNVPTVAELGYPGFEASAWYATFAPAGTPGPVVARLAEHTSAVLREQDLIAKFQSLGAEVYSLQGEALAKMVRSEVAKWGDVIKGAGIKSN
jgi:tripartite-type tricarboxylate transporter receptor subunit TctC